AEPPGATRVHARQGGARARDLRQGARRARGARRRGGARPSPRRRRRARRGGGGARAGEARRRERVGSVEAAVAAVRWAGGRGPAAAGALRGAYDAAARDTSVDERTRAIDACKLAMAHDRAVGKLALVPACGGANVSERERGVWTAQALADVGGPELAQLAAS